MRKMTRAAPLAVVLTTAAMLTLGVAGAAQARSPLEKPAAAPTQCFWARNVTNFAAADEKTVNLRVGVRDVYQLEMMGRCHDIDWTQAIAIKSHGSSRICSGLDAELIAPSPIGPMTCPVRSIRKLTPEEVAALPRRGRP